MLKFVLDKIIYAKKSAYFCSWQRIGALDGFTLVVGEGVQVTDVDRVLFVLPARGHPGADFKVGRFGRLLHLLTHWQSANRASDSPAVSAAAARIRFCRPVPPLGWFWFGVLRKCDSSGGGSGETTMTMVSALVLLLLLLLQSSLLARYFILYDRSVCVHAV